MTHIISADASDAIELGPDSLLWRLAGDMRIAFTGGTAGFLQTLHPSIGHALIDHSDFFADPVDRVFRSLPGILGTVYDARGDDTGLTVRDFHRDIKGVRPDGVRYHALDPDTYWWAHATFQVMVEQVADLYSRRKLREGERERLYREGLEWFRRYGVSGRPLPPDRAAFQAEWERYCVEVLRPNPASDYLITVIEGHRAPDMGVNAHIPTPEAWSPRTRRRFQALLSNRWTRTALSFPMRLTIYGGVPPVVKERVGIRWTLVDRLGYAVVRKSVQLSWRFLPMVTRWHPTALRGWGRLGGAPRSATR